MLSFPAARRLLHPDAPAAGRPAEGGAPPYAPVPPPDPLVFGALTALQRSREYAQSGDTTRAALYRDTARCRARSAALRREAVRGWALRAE